MQVQISMFEMLEPETRFRHELKHGSGFEGGKVRIYAASMNLDNKEFAVFLRNEYGIGGHSATFPDGGSGFTDYDAKGLVIREWRTNVSERHNWNECAREIRNLIISGEYLTDAEFRKVQEVAKENGGRLPLPHPRCAWAYEVTA